MKRVRRAQLIGRATLVRLAACAVLLSTLLGTLSLASTAGNAGASATQFRTAYYFGPSGPIDFWDSDLSGAARTFSQMKADGFNAVGLVVPWGEFQPHLNPPVENKVAFNRLKHLIALAGQQNLQVVLRLSYIWDSDPKDKLPWGARFPVAFGNNTVYSAWLTYIKAVHDAVSPYHNVAVAFLSWEDFWAPIWAAQSARTVADRVHLAQITGYQNWLSHRYTLADVSYGYGQTFTSWSQVPTPLRDTPAFAQMFSFDDSLLKNRFFFPAAQRYPGLTLEARFDQDQILNGSQVVGLYNHMSTWHLRGAPISGITWDPYMDDPQPTVQQESANDALWSLYSVLNTVQNHSGGRPVFINEFEFVSNALVVNSAPSLPPSQVAPFLNNAGPVLGQHSIGYGLWTYRNFPLTAVYNPSFSVGTSGWKVTGTVKAITTPHSGSFLTMSKGSSVYQRMAPRRPIPGLFTNGTVAIRAWAGTSPAGLFAKMGNSTISLGLKSGWRTYYLTFPVDAFRADNLTLSATGPLNVTNVQAYNFLQVGDIYSAAGKPKPALSALRTLNSQMASSG